MVYNHNYKIRISRIDLYCRYLPVGLVRGGSRLCNGKFYKYMKDRFHIEELPYNINIHTLISEGALKPGLFVKLPEEAFESWENFPKIKRITTGEVGESINSAYHYDIEILPYQLECVNDASHPYDSEYESLFVDIFKEDPPNLTSRCTHKNGSTYYPYEAYMPYWKGYVLADAFLRCYMIDRYLDPVSGKNKFIDAVSKSDNELDLLSDTFDRLSWYRTVTTNIHMVQECKLDVTEYNIVCYVLDKTDSTVDDLHKDLELLLSLHHRWKAKRQTEMHLAENALKLIEYDVFTAYLMLCAHGESSQILFRKWSVTDRMSKGWTELSEAVPFDDIKFQKYLAQQFVIT